MYSPAEWSSLCGGEADDMWKLARAFHRRQTASAAFRDWFDDELGKLNLRPLLESCFHVNERRNTCLIQSTRVGQCPPTDELQWFEQQLEKVMLIKSRCIGAQHVLRAPPRREAVRRTLSRV